MDSPLAARQRPSPWYWVLARVAPLLTLIAVGSLLWLLHRHDLEQQRTALITDVLWAEQNMHFQLERNAEQLQRLGLERALGQVDPAGFGVRARSIITNGQGLVQILLLDSAGQAVSVEPARPSTAADTERQESLSRQEQTQLARTLGRASYGTPYAAGPNDHEFEVFVPVFAEQRHVGTVIGVYSLRRMLAQLVPWWFGSRYKLLVLNNNGAVLAATTQLQTLDATLSYQMPFDPPGHGLSLQAVSFRAETRLLPDLLVTAIVSLALATLVSLWALRRHMQRRHHAEQALREEYAFRKAMEDSLTTGLRARDLDGRVTHVNRAFCEMVGWSADELVGRTPPMPYWPPEHAEAIQTAHERVLAGQAPREGFEVRLMRRNGERFDALIHEAPLIDTHGRHTGWMGSVLDITARKRAEELARHQQEKLQASAHLVTMGELASTLAHELNQPLSAIASYATGCLNRLEAGHSDREEMMGAVGKIARQAQRAGRIIRRIYDFVRRSDARRDRCDVNAIVEDAVGLMDATARKLAVRIRPGLAPTLPPVLADRVLVQQAVMNLVQNGLDAMADTPANQRELSVTTERADGAVCISVADRGCGIPPDAADKLFAPFFTTKPEGMGMGLNLCRSVAEQHNGRLWFEARDGRGTVFHITLPVQEA
ncbi:MAG: PAS domain S-box protein [Betaproteobacteria bacterium]|nr:PAS domain S-box protein [Betaproteobacteria bacterium]